MDTFPILSQEMRSANQALDTVRVHMALHLSLVQATINHSMLKNLRQDAIRDGCGGGMLIRVSVCSLYCVCTHVGMNKGIIYACA